MAVTTIIVRGQVEKAAFAPPGYYLLRDRDGARVYIVGSWAEPYLAQTLIISIEEPEEELDPIIDKRLRRALTSPAMA